MERMRLTERRQAQMAFAGDLTLRLGQLSSAQLEVVYVVLDPGLTGVGADVFAPSGFESVERGADR